MGTQDRLGILLVYHVHDSPVGALSEAAEVPLDVVLEKPRRIGLGDCNIDAEYFLPGLTQDFITSLFALGL